MSDEGQNLPGLLSSLAGVVVGGVIALVTTFVTLNHSDSSQRESEARTRNAAIYQEYLNSADAFMVASGGVQKSCGSKPSDGVLGCIFSESGSWYKARQRYQAATNALFVYGSDNAWTAHDSVANQLPGLPGDVTDRPLYSFEPDVYDVEGTRYRTSYKDFQRVMCRELALGGAERCS